MGLTSAEEVADHLEGGDEDQDDEDEVKTVLDVGSGTGIWQIPSRLLPPVLLQSCSTTEADDLLCRAAEIAREYPYIEASWTILPSVTEPG